MFGSASADLMMSRAPSCGSSSTGRIPGCNRTPRLAIYGLEERLLDGGVHTRLLGVGTTAGVILACEGAVWLKLLLPPSSAGAPA
jgi:hypothetical protein